MNVVVRKEHSTTARITPVLRTLVLCDIADSTALVGRLGDQNAADLFRKHDRLARALLNRHCGREIDKTDGFLVMFDRPIQAVAFALEYQHQLRQLAEEEGCTLGVRVGIHIGDVMVWDNDQQDIENGAKATEVEGLAKPIASRLMQLALPGQILLSNIAYTLAHRAQGELGEALSRVRWRMHGRYLFKGVPDAVPVFEVGEEGIAPLRAPPWSGKAHREVPFWRRPFVLAFEATLLLAAISIPAWYLLKPEPAIAFANRDWVVVGDLKNFTGESKFDESLQTAFRLGLEQSRHVNVLSDLKARETIKLMQRDPDTTRIDRVVGTEIAMRDGARALILPSIAEIGGRVRVTAEVIDPKSQATVYSESADGMGESSVLASVDKVNRGLRQKLGEGFSVVSGESQPLERVATKNLDALRAYSLGAVAYNKRNMEEAVQMYQHALKLDPEFALARLALGRIWSSYGRSADAVRELDAAMVLRKNLTPRDALYVEAMRATFDEPKAALAKWKMLGTLYPDFFPGIGAYAYFDWQLTNNYDESAKSAIVSASSRNAHRGASQYLLGILFLGRERYDEALKQFEALGSSEGVPVLMHAAVYAAQRKFDRVEPLLARGKSTVDDPDEVKFRTAVAIDQGRRDEARELLRRARARPEVSPEVKVQFELIDFSLASLDGGSADLSRSGHALVKAMGDLPPASSGVVRGERKFCALVLAYLAARTNDLKLAQDALALADPGEEDGSYPVVANMADVARAEIASAEKKPGEAIAILEKRINGRELYVTHLALMDAYRKTGRLPKAQDASKWLSLRRGQAYTEVGAEWLMTPFNVAQSNLALLRGSEMARADGQVDLANRLQQQFSKAWPDSEPRPFTGSDTSE